jgi:protein required for attachment to host cells
MDGIWVVVADQAQARIYACDRLGHALTLVKTMDHPDGRAHVGDLLADDSAPRTHDRFGDGRHSMAEPQDVKQVLVERFARQVAEMLGEAHHAGRYRKLALVAPPQLLGQLRLALDGPVKDVVVCEVDKHLVQAAPETVANTLREASLA